MYSSSHPSRLWQPSTLLGAAWCARCNASTSASDSEAPLGQSSTANDTILRGEKLFETKKIRFREKGGCCFLSQVGFVCFFFLREKPKNGKNCRIAFPDFLHAGSERSWKIQRLNGSKIKGWKWGLLAYPMCAKMACKRIGKMVPIQNKVQQAVVAFLHPWSMVIKFLKNLSRNPIETKQDFMTRLRGITAESA